jgi:hypothetical protein
MHPRWHHEKPGAPLIPGETPGGRSGAERETEAYFNAPLPDLEQQLAAELGGASWAAVAFTADDGAWCDWIYRNLNGYPLPPSLVDRVTPHGFPRPDCLSVFPDRRDPAYEEHYGQALKEGVYLIVVCSAASVHDAGIEGKIRDFKNAGGEERIIALVVDGPPEAKLGERLRAAQCDWLPSWLQWRLEADGFRTADRSEPRVVDARRGYRSLKQVRDSLLTALVDMDGAEFERLGGCNRPVEGVELSEPPSVAPAPEMTTSVAFPTPIPSSRRGGSKYTIWTAVGLIVVAVVFGAHSFREITADDPVSTLEVGSVPTAHAARAKGMEEISAEETAAPNVAATTAPTASAGTEAGPGAATVSEPAAETPAREVAAVTPLNAPVAVQGPAPAATVGGEVVAPAKSNVSQVVPGTGFATSRIVPTASYAMTSAVATAVAPVSMMVSVNSPSSTESDAVLQDEVRTLERRGDETMAQKRTEDALDLYGAALASAEEFAARKNSGAVARDHVVALEKKLAMLELQNASTAEARATYIQARKGLLLLKSQGQWSHDRAKTLDEIEKRLLSLPRE